MTRVLITGSSRGIGKETALKFLAHGAFVFGIDVLPSTISSPSYVHFVADVRKPESLPKIEDLTYIVNNAGVYEVEEDPIGVNLYGVFNIEDKYVKTSIKTLEAIVNVSSTTAFDGQANREYTCSKGALNSYSVYLCNELGKYGIRVNTVVPGCGITDMNKKYLESAEVRGLIATQNLLGRWGHPAETAAAIYFLCAEATFTTGATLMIDGGELVKTRYIRAIGETRPYDPEVLSI